MTKQTLKAWLEEQKKDQNNHVLSDGTISLHTEVLLWRFIGYLATEVQIHKTFWDYPITFQSEIVSMINHHLEVHHGEGAERLTESLISIQDSISAHQEPFISNPEIVEPEDPRDGKLFPN